MGGIFYEFNDKENAKILKGKVQENETRRYEKYTKIFFKINRGSR